jgi:hypothetical protein
MTLLQQPIERALSSLLGMEVKFEQYKVSLLAATIEVTGIKIGGGAISAARGVANISIGRALKGEIIVKSISIERLDVNIPALPKRSPKPPSEKPREPPPLMDEEKEKPRWTFDIEKLLILEGRLVISPKLTLEKLLLELKRDDAGYKLTLLADKFADGAVRGHLQYNGKLSLAQLLALL